RRHTRSYGDWSSDVCSSDLGASPDAGIVACADGGSIHPCATNADCPCPLVCAFDPTQSTTAGTCTLPCSTTADCPLLFTSCQSRSEERRVGKECRCRGDVVA